MFFFLGRCGPYLHVLIPLACQGNELHLLLARYVFAQLWASFKPTISPLPYWIPAYSAHGGECKVDVYLPLFTFVSSLLSLYSRHQYTQLQRSARARTNQHYRNGIAY